MIDVINFIFALFGVLCLAAISFDVLRLILGEPSVIGLTIALWKLDENQLLQLRDDLRERAKRAKGK